MENEPQNVVITNIKLPFFSIVIFMIKWMLASIPALIIVGIIFAGLGFGISILVEMFDLGYLFDGVIVLPPH